MSIWMSLRSWLQSIWLWWVGDASSAITAEGIAGGIVEAHVLMPEPVRVIDEQPLKVRRKPRRAVKAKKSRRVSAPRKKRRA